MNEPATPTASTSAPHPGLLWTGRVLSVLCAALLIMSGVMKLQGGPELEKNLEPSGIPMSMVFPLGIVEITCTVLYLIPQTAVLGAVLLTGYMGGAICTHWRIGDAFYIQSILGVVIWLGIYLREPRLWRLMPFRRELR